MKQFIVDAFTDKLFGGNQAAVCMPDGWPSDDLMQSIAITIYKGDKKNGAVR